jgi:hypothetical protein
MKTNGQPDAKSKPAEDASAEHKAEAPDDHAKPLPDGEAIAEVGDAVGGPA